MMDKTMDKMEKVLMLQLQQGLMNQPSKMVQSNTSVSDKIEESTTMPTMELDF